jgi:ATP-dependent Clp protease ATP-binding subunit ClpC
VATNRLTPDSDEAVRAYIEAEDVAAQHAQAPSSAHLLLALFNFSNRAQVLLRERRIDADWVRRKLTEVQAEPRRSFARLKERARDIARQSEAAEVDCLHVLVAITRQRDCAAYAILKANEATFGTSMSALRNVAVSYINGNLPRRFAVLPKAHSQADGMRLVLQGRQPKRAGVSESLRAEPTIVSVERAAAVAPIEAASQPAGHSVAALAPLEVFALPQGVEALVDSSVESLETGFEAAQSATLQGTTPAESSEPSTEAVQTSMLLGTTPADLLESSAEAALQPVSSDLQALAPTLCACGIDLTERARRGELDAAVGRETEIQTLIDILGKRRGNNPILIGSPGVGKTAIVEGLAVKIVRRDPEVSSYFDCHLVALDTGSLEAGTGLRGAFSERLGAIKAEVAAAQRRIIVFIDEIHCLLGAGQSGEGSSDAAAELKAALARGEFPCIGATTDDEFTRYIEKDAALERRFTAIAVQEPSCAHALLILEGAIAPYAQHHGVTYTLSALQAAVHLSHQFVTERKLPDKAFAAIDLAGSRAHRNGATTVERTDVAQVISDWSKVPLQRLVAADMQRLSEAESALSSKLVGHAEVVQQVARTLRRGFAGLNGARPMGSFLFLGPTGVGKTELAKVLAEYVFGRRDALVRFDMSELSERHSVARLVGAQPGYVGFEEGGQLTEALRKRPFQIVLFDEIEKAHPNVLNLLLQVLDDGLLTDSRGRHIAFNHALIIMTSNLGSDAVGPRGIGFGQRTEPGKEAAQRLRRSILTAAQAGLTKELWSRVDEHLVFLPLQPAQLQQVATLQLRACAARLLQQQQVHLLWDTEVPQHLSQTASAATALGARSLRQSLSHLVESPIAEMLLAGKLRAQHTVRLSVTAQQRLKVSRQARPPASRPEATA